MIDILLYLAKANWLSNNLCHPLAQASGNSSSGNLSSGNSSMVKLWFVSTFDLRSRI
jgi:hypothetical protein